MSNNDQHSSESRSERKDNSAPRRWLYLLVAVVTIAFLFCVGWLPRYLRQKEVLARANQEKNALPIVEVVTVEHAPAKEELTLPGTVVPVSTNHVYARSAGSGGIWEHRSTSPLDLKTATKSSSIQPPRFKKALTSRLDLRPKARNYDQPLGERASYSMVRVDHLPEKLCDVLPAAFRDRSYPRWRYLPIQRRCLPIQPACDTGPG